MEEKNIILAFDGPDNVGKSTQIKKVRKYFKNLPFVVLNLEAPVGENNEERLNYGLENMEKYFELILSAREKNIPVILDRCHFSEYAYSFLRGGHKIEKILKLEKKFEELKENLIIFTFIDEAENIIKRDDGLSAFDPEKKEEVEKIINNFKEISRKSLFQNFLMNIRGEDEEKVFKEIIDRLENMIK